MATGNPILDAAYSGAASTSAVVSQSSAGIINDRTAQQTLADNTASLQLDVGANNAIIDSVKSQAALQAQQTRQKIGVDFGTDKNAQGYQILDLTQQMNQAWQQKQDALTAIQQKDSVGFMDNPLGFIMNQFSVNDDIRAHNSALELEQSAAQHISQLNQLTDQTIATQKNFETNITQASIDAQTKNTLAIAQQAANKTEAEGLGYNIDALQTSINASKEQTALKFQTLAAQNAQADLKTKMDEFTLHQKQVDYAMEQKTNSDMTDAYLTNKMQIGLDAMYGVNAPDLVSSPKAAKLWVSLLKMGGEVGAEARMAMTAGNSAGAGKEGRVLGSTDQVVSALQNGTNLMFTPAQSTVKDLLEKTSQSVQQGIATGLVKKDQVAATINTDVTTKLDTYLQNINPADKSNPFNIPSFAAVLKMPGMGDLPLVSQVLAPAVASGTQLTDPNTIFHTGLAAVEAGKISQEDLISGIKAVVQKGVDTNLAALNLPKFGIVPNELMQKYPTTITTGSSFGFGNTALVNMTDDNSIAAAVNKARSAAMLGKINPFILGMKAGQQDPGQSMIPDPRGITPHSLAGYN